MKSFYNRITGSVGDFIKLRHAWIAAGMLVVMFGLALGSMVGNSAIVDEVAHIPSGYSYLHYGDYRLNPEHPPLIKDLAGLPLQFMNLKFPVDQPSWTTDVNGQWEAGWNFLYHIGNNADAILFWSRLPILLLAIAFGALLYWWVKRKWGLRVALLMLFFYAFSPNLLGHSTLVTTDLGASVFFFLAIVTFARFIERPSGSNLVLLSLGLAGAQLAKFSAILLFPVLGLMSLAAVWVLKDPKQWLDRAGVYVGGFITASGLSVLWVWLFYVPHTWNMPQSVQDRLIEGSLPSSNVAPVVNFLTTLNDVSVFKPLVQYLLGLTMVFGRVAGGNVTYFDGQVTNQSFHGYFPQLFVMKTQVALLVLIGVPLVLLVRKYLRRMPKKPVAAFKTHVREHFVLWCLGFFAAFYFLVSVAGNLNLGIRHILPIYVPIFLIVSVVTITRLNWLAKTSWRQAAMGAFAVLLLWYAGSTVAQYPNFLSYFNEVGGGPKQSDRYFSDSSVDWGQDLKRLKTYVNDHPEINHIAIDYFGGGVPAYYFCQRKYDDQGRLIATAAGYDCSHSVMEDWHSQYGHYTGQYIAVSETFLVNDEWYSILNGTEGYRYLREREPMAKVGNSIYVYKLY